jgi:hypothetical protein
LAIIHSADAGKNPSREFGLADNANRRPFRGDVNNFAARA